MVPSNRRAGEPDCEPVSRYETAGPLRQVNGNSICLGAHGWFTPNPYGEFSLLAKGLRMVYGMYVRTPAHDRRDHPVGRGQVNSECSGAENILIFIGSGDTIQNSVAWFG